ncbi:MAG: transporter substrate-binding domain-containing protein, partial [Chitinivibrionales bacterium]|nr:transporter substrate-binding domain-containing protein [Chitinivibrionales bacterium]MBD3356913.1 transporter substrate-binding domain-containing protein [Chitinivibrionales bacterium]
MFSLTRLISIILVVAFCTVPVRSSGPDSATMTLKVATYDFYPLCRAVSDELHDGGLFISLLEEMAMREGWAIEYVPGTMTEGLDRLANYEVDLALAASYSREAAERFTFTRETVISTWANVYAPDKSNVQSLLDLAGKVIGVVRDDPYNQNLRSTIRKFDMECTFVEFNDYNQVFAGVTDGWIDVGIVDRLYGALHEKKHQVQRTPIIFSPVDLRFAVHGEGHADVISVLDYHLAAFKRDTRSEYYQELDRILGVIEETQVPAALLYGLGITSGLLLLVGAGALVLRRQVKLKTAEISRKNGELECEVARRSAAETAVRQSSELMTNIFSSMRDALLLVESGDQRIAKINRAAADMFRYQTEEMIGQSAGILLPDHRAAETFEKIVPLSINAKGYMRGEFRMRRKDGTRFPAELVVTPVKSEIVSGPSWVMIVRDNTLKEELEHNERRLRQAQKMEAIGTLAGGIAHDFNNILMPVLGYAELMQRLVPESETVQHHYLEQVMQAANRARSLVSQILAFSRQREQDKSPLRVSPVVKEALKLLRASLPSTITIRHEVLTERDLVLADPTQIHQVVMNLCTN